MNILFVTGQITPLSDANTLIIMRISAELINQRSNISITILGFNETPLDMQNVLPNGVRIKEFRPNKRMPYSDALKLFLKQTSTQGTKKRIKKLVLHPLVLLELLIKRYVNGSLSKQYSREVKKICRQQSFNVIIGVSAPFHAPFGVAKAKRPDIPFIYYQLDPYFSHYLQPYKRKSLRQEEMVCERAAHIVLTDLIQKDYQNSILEKYLRKSSVFGFPAFSDVTFFSSTGSFDKRMDLGDTTRLVFVGSLYGDIRSPLYLLQLASLLKKEGHRIHIDFVGPILQALSSEINQYIDELGNDVEFHGKVGSEEVKGWIDKADILINIANTIPNQLPSKIFEYFSSGKPILNLYKIENCPTLEYMNVYPNSLCIPEFEGINKELVENVWAFFEDMRGKVLPYDYVADLFSENTTQYVCERLIEIIDKTTPEERDEEL